MPYKYTATTQILIDPMELHSAGNELTSPSQQSDAAVLTVESQVRVLTSDNLLSRVVTAEGLDHDPEFVRGASSLEYASLAALNELKRHLSVSRADRTYVIDVSVTSEDPAKAARIANAIAKVYLAEQTEVRSDNARQISQSLSGRLKELQDRVRDSENRVEAYKSSHNIVGANGELVDEQQLASLNAQLSAAHARTEEAKSRLDQIEGAKRSKTDMGAFPAAIQSQTITALRTQYAEIMRREAEQKTSLGERHPAVIEIEAQAERLQHMIDDEVARVALSARAEYQSAKTNEDTLTRNLDTLKQTAMSTNESLVGLRELEREVQANRAVYEAFLVRARETGEQEQSRYQEYPHHLQSRPAAEAQLAAAESGHCPCGSHARRRHRHGHRADARYGRNGCSAKPRRRCLSPEVESSGQDAVACSFRLIRYSGAGDVAAGRCQLRPGCGRGSALPLRAGDARGLRGDPREP